MLDDDKKLYIARSPTENGECMTTVLETGSDLRTGGLEAISEQPHRKGIYTQGREWEPDTSDIWFGVDTEKFYKNTTRRFTTATTAVETVYTVTKDFFAKRWYMTAVPVAAGIAIGIYSTLMSCNPEVEIQEATNVRKRKKGPLEYFMKYYSQGKKSALDFIDGDAKK